MLKNKEISQENAYILFIAIQSCCLIDVDHATTAYSVNEACKILFAQKGRQIENVQLSEDAFQQHIWRASYQSAFVWGQRLTCQMVLPDPACWGWTNPNKWQPPRTTLPEASIWHVDS